MFSPGANDPRASVPPNACDSTSALSSDGGGLWDKSSYLKDTRLERGDRDKILSGRRDWADRSFIVSSQRALCSNETGPFLEKVHERHERGERERNFEGKREWPTSKTSVFPSQRATFSNGNSFSTVSKRYPGRHGFYKENGRYGSTCTRTGEAALSDDNNGAKIERDPHYGVAEATTGSSDINMGHTTKDLETVTNRRACLLSGDRMQDGSTQVGERSPIVQSLCELEQSGHRNKLKDGSIFQCISPKKGERDNISDTADVQKNAGIFQDDVLQVKNVVDKVVVEGRLGLRLNYLDSCSEDAFVSNSTLGSTLKQNSERSLERVVSTSSRRSAFAVGNGFSNDLIARSHTSLDTSLLLLSPRSSSHSAVLGSSLGSTLSVDNPSPRKRPRLGWGQGLAKYEQKKVEGNISSSVTICGGNSEFEAPPSLCTDDERTALKGNGRFPSATSSGDPDLIVERLSESEVCGGSSTIKRESCYQSSEEAKAFVGDLRTLHQSGTLQEKSAAEKFEKVESLQVQVEQVSTFKSSELLVFDKFSGVTRDSPDICEAPASTEDVVEANHWAPKDLSSWTKQEILAGIEKLELEIDLVEKEILKLDLDAGDDLQNASAPSVTVGVDENTEETGCTTVENLEEPHMSEETLFQQPVDQHQTLQTSPWEVSSDFQMQQPQQEVEDPCMQAAKSDDEGKMTPDIEVSTVASQEGVIETGHSDSNNPVGLKILSGSQEPLSSVDAVENDVLLDMQKLHLQSVHALLDENQIQSRCASRPFIHLLPERLQDVESRRLESQQDVRVWEHNECDNDGLKERMLEKLAKHKQFIRFKEQVLALKYRALKELWKQEQLGNSQKKDRSKTFRKSESERKNGTVSVTQRFSLRLRPTLSGSGRLDAAPDEVKVMSKVLADRSDEHVRPFLRMPAMVLDDKERDFQKFVSKNGLVEDPLSLEQERETINPWTSEERQIFLDKFGTFNKNFSKIASYIEHKTTADCVVFYYRNHKSEDFEKIRRRHQLKKKRDYSRSSASYLATTVLPAGVRNREGNLARVEDITLTHTNSSSREVLRPGRASSHKSMERTHFGGPSELRSCISGALTKSTGAKESKAASNLLAVAAGVASGAAMSPCSLSTSVFPSRSGIDSNMFRENSLGQISFRSRMETLGDFKASHLLHDRPGAGKSVGEQLEFQWNDNEKHSFVDALGLYGKDFRRIAQHVKTKTQGQCKAFFSKSRKRLNLDQILSRSQTSSQPLLEAEVDAVQPTSNLKTVKVEEFVACMNAVIPPEDVHLEETVTTCVEATTKEPEDLVLEPVILKDDMKALSGGEGNQASLSEQVSKDFLHHTSASSPSTQKAENTVEMAESTGMPNELQCTQVVCESSPTNAESDVDVNHINKDVGVLGSEGCSCCPTKAGESLKTQATESAMLSEEAMEIATTSCTASSGVVINEHESTFKRPKLEADSPSISSSVPPEMPSLQSVPHQVSHAPRLSNVTNVIKNSQLYERTVKAGGETRNRREATSWAQEEKEIFAETIKKHGKDWAVLQESLPSKSLTQIKTYFQNSKAKLGYAPDNVGSGSSQAICSRKRKADESDTNIRFSGKLNPQKGGQSIISDGSLNANSGDVNPNVNMTGVGAEQLAYAMLARNGGQVVEDVAVVNDVQRLLRQLGSNGLTTQTAASLKQLSASGISESAPSSGHFLGSMQGQLLSNSLYASIQQQLLSACKQPSSGNNPQQQLSVPQLPVQQHQLAQSASKQQLTHSFQQQGQASSILNQKLAHQLSQQQSSSPIVTLNNQQFFNQVAHRFQQHVAHQQQQKQAIQPQQQQIQQVAHQQVQNAISPLMVLQQEPSDSASHLHKQVIMSCHQQPAPHHAGNQQQPLIKQQQHCQLLNQQKVVDQQQLFAQQQQQQVAFKQQQQVLIQQQSQLHQTPISQMVQHQHQFLHQQQLKKIALQQQLNVLNQSQDHQNEKFTLQMLQHGLQLKANQQLLQQKDVQVPNFDESATISKQLSTTCLDQQQFQTRPMAASLGSLKRLGSGSDMLNTVDVELRRLQVPQLSPEDSQSSQPDSEVSLRPHSRGETCSEAQPGRSGDVKLFGQSLLSQPSSSGSKSSSASPTGNGRFLLRPFSPSLLASPASVSVSSILPPPKFIGGDSATSSSLDKEVRHSPGSRTHHPGNSLTTNMANGLQNVTVPRMGVVESHSVQEAVAFMTQRLVQTRGLEHGTHGESSTASGPHNEFHRGLQEPCRDEKSLRTIRGPVKGRCEQNTVTFHSNGVASQVDTEMDNDYVKVDERCTSASKSGGQSMYPFVNQGLSRGVLDAIMAITTRQNVQGSAYAGGSTRVDSHGLLRSFVNGLEPPEGIGTAEVPNSLGHSYVGGHDILQHIIHNYLSSSQVLNLSRQTAPDDNACTTASGSRLTITDRMELVPNILPATHSTVEEPLRSSDTQEVNSSGSVR